MVEDDIRLLLKENSNFITYGTPPGISLLKDVSEVHSRVFQNGFETSRSERESVCANGNYYKSDSTVAGYDDFTMKADQKVWYVIKAIRFDEKSFFSAILGFGPHWAYRSYNEYISQKSTNLGTNENFRLKCDLFVGSVVIGIREPVVSSSFGSNSGF